MKILTFPTGRINSNCYVVEKEGKCLVIDVAYHCQKLIDYINSNNLQVVAILLTHGHFDHCGGVEELKRGCNLADVPVCVHKDDAELCQDAQHNWFRITCENCYPTHFVEEGTLQIENFHLQVLHTPGHTPGSVVYLLDDVMFSGDTLFYMSVGRTDFPKGDFNQLKNSLQKIAKLQTNYKIYPGHSQCTTLLAELQHNPYLN